MAVVYSFFDVLSKGSSLEALSFLQESLSRVTDPNDREEQQDLKMLFTTLVRGAEAEASLTQGGESDSTILRFSPELIYSRSSRALRRRCTSRRIPTDTAIYLA